MNNAPLTLILIASLGIVAVISLGVFFAVRPKFANTEEHLAADFVEQAQLYTTGSSSSPARPSSPPIDSSHQNSHHKSPIPLTSTLESIGAPPFTILPPGFNVGSPGQRSKIVTAAHSPGADLPRSHALPGEPTFGQSSKNSGDREIVSTVELLDSLRVAPGPGAEQNVRASAQLIPPTTPSSSPSKSITLKEIKAEKEIDMHRYGKVVGLAYRKGRLYVPSYQNGNVSVYKGDTMQLLNEYSCDGCHIYDIGVLSTGDMILSQGKYSKLTKLNNKTGTVTKEVVVPYSSKGVAVSPYDEIFVLSRDHDSIYVYDAELKQLGVLPLENKAKNDCNFLAYGSDLIYVSCESSTHVVDVQGKQVQLLKPSQGTYAIGVAVNSESTGQIYVGQRGSSVVDVYDKNGKYSESIGEKKDSLWSDIVVGGKYLYVIEYITATIKQYRLR